jgi:hypothetical protein
MQSDYLSNLRAKLQRRLRRVKAMNWTIYVLVLRQFWTFYDSEPFLVAAAEELLVRFPGAEELASRLAQGILRGEFPVIENEEEWAAISYFMLRQFAKETDSRNVNKFVPLKSSTAYDAYLQTFAEFYLEPFCDYIDEQLDDTRFVLGQLIRFKHLSEWFWRPDLYSSWTGATVRGEKILALKLYEFLYREGIRIHIEPASVSGEADMVGSQEGPDRLVADAKVFNPDRSKGITYILQGFRQIYQYTGDYNAAVGYLVIFNTSNKQLRFAVRGGSEPLPKVEVNHKTIFFVVIDLYPHETSASKRPQAEVVEITEKEIAGIATAVGPQSTAVPN